jgi:hypothetical protein
MVLFAAAFALHVLAAILGVGPVVAIAIVSSRGPTTGELAIDRRDLLAPLSRWVSVAFALMLLTGVLLDIGAGGSFHETGWFRASGLLLIIAGVLNGVARRRLRRNDSVAPSEGIRLVARTSWWMCAIVAVITLLMTLRPG